MPTSLRSTPPYWSLAARGGGDVAGRAGAAAEPLAAGSSSVLDPGVTRADAVVVGAGVAGLLVAEALAAIGREVVVVEAREVASGVSGSSTAKVSALHGSTYHQLEGRHGEETARAYGQANLAGVEHVGRVVADHGLDCGWERLPAFTYTTDPTSVEVIDAEVAAWSAEARGDAWGDVNLAELALLQARWLTSRGEPAADALRACDEALARARRQGPQDPALLLASAERAAFGRAPGAAAAFEAAVQADPRNPRTLLRAARHRLAIGDAATARRLASRATAINPELGEAWQVQGLAGRDLGDPQAAALIERGRRLDPNAGTQY